MLDMVIMKHGGGITYSNTYSDTSRLGSSQIDLNYSNPYAFSFGDPYESARVLPVSSQTPPAPEEHGTTAAQHLIHHIIIGGRSPTSLSLLYLDLPGLCTSILRQLSEGRWRGLHNLTLCEAGLKAPDWLMLGQGNLPNLVSLSTTKCGLDADAMASLAKANWPWLSSLHLRDEPKLDAAAVAHLCAASYTIIDMSLSDIPVTAAMAAELGKRYCLDSISLFGTDLTAAAATEMAKANWPELIRTQS